MIRKSTKYKRKENVVLVEQKQNSKKENEPKKAFLFSEAFLIGIIPFLVYGLIFAKDSKYLDFYGVPSNFINYDLAEIIIFSIFLIFLVISVFFIIVMSPLNDFWWKIKDKNTKFDFIYWAIFIIIVGLWGESLWQNDIKDWSVVIIVAGFLTPIIKYQRQIFSKFKGNHPNKEKELVKSTSNEKPNTRTIFKEFISFLGDRIIRFIVLYILVFCLFSEYGYSEAHLQVTFPIVHTDPKCNVIYTTSDRFFCKTLDNQNNEFENGYTVLYLQDLKGIVVDSEDLGSTKVKPTPTPIPTITPTTNITLSPVVTAIPTTTP